MEKIWEETKEIWEEEKEKFTPIGKDLESISRSSLDIILRIGSKIRQNNTNKEIYEKESLDAQKWLNELNNKYPKDQRGKIVFPDNTLDIGEEIENTQTKERKSDKYIKVTLTGSLNLNDFANLEGLVFSPIGYPLSDNRIDNLITDDCKNLKNVEFYSSNLVHLEIDNYQHLQYVSLWDSKKLEALTLTNNPRLEEVDCSECESAYHLILVNNPKLKSLRIDNSKKVTIDLLNLPENLERVYCEGTNLTEKLKGYDKQEKIKARDKDNNVKDITFTYYDYRSWRKDHQDLISKVENSQVQTHIEIPPKQ